MKSRSWMAGVGVCLAMGMAGAAVGAEYYINDDTYVPGDDVYTFAKGHDGNPGTAALPKATLGNVIGTCNLQPGDVVYIDTGTYAPVVISNTVVGAAGAPIVITGVPITNWNSGGTVFSIRHIRFVLPGGTLGPMFSMGGLAPPRLNIVACKSIASLSKSGLVVSTPMDTTL